MAAGDPVYGTKTALANVSRLDSDASNYATAFGEVDNNTTPKPDYEIHLKCPISSSATAGTYDFYLLTSMDGTEWTDGIDPATDADYADFIKDAFPIKSCGTIYDNSPTGARTNVELHFRVSEITGYPVPPYFGFVRVNKSGQTAPSSGHDGDSMSVSLATS